MLKDSKATTPDQEPRPSRLRKYAAILLFAVIAVVVIDGYFSNWSIVRTLISLNTLQLRDRADHTWDLLERRDFRLVKVNDVRSIVDTDSLLSFDKPYREAGYYRLYFRSSDSSSANLQKMYQALLSYDTAQTIQRTVQDAQRAYGNLQRILRLNKSTGQDTVKPIRIDSARKIVASDVPIAPGDEAMAVMRKVISDPHVLAGVGIGIVASAGIDLLRGNAYVAYSRDDVFRLDTLKVGSRVGMWEGLPIDILWAFGKQDTTAGANALPDSTGIAKKDSVAKEKQ